MNEENYKMIMNYFPPVDFKIDNIYLEADIMYSHYLTPLKLVPHDTVYSEQIISNLRTLRILLNSPNVLEEEGKRRFIYEINLLLTAWGPNGTAYNQNILDDSLVALINKINKQKLREDQMIKMAQEYTDLQLEQEMSQLNFNNKNKIDMNSLDNQLKYLNLGYGIFNRSKNSAIIKRKKSKKR